MAKDDLPPDALRKMAQHAEPKGIHLQGIGRFLLPTARRASIPRLRGDVALLELETTPGQLVVVPLEQAALRELVSYLGALKGMIQRDDFEKSEPSGEIIGGLCPANPAP